MAEPFVYFDAGFTLLEVFPSVGHHYGEHGRRWGVDVDSAALNTAFFQAWRVCKRQYPVRPGVPYGCSLDEARIFWDRVVAESFRLAGAVPPADPAFYRGLFDHFATAACWRLYDDVEPALRLLDARGIQWGVLSNWDPRLHPVLEALGLRDRLSALIISSEVGAEKPSPEIFAAARRMANTDRLLMIGDEDEADGFGATEAGWAACVVDRSGRSGEPGRPWGRAATLTAAVEKGLAALGCP